MKRFDVHKLRNLVLISHGGAGKTSLAEAMLYTAGTTDRLGRVDDGNATMDYDPEEIRRQVSISTGIAPAIWDDHKLNILDAPGYFDFVGEVRAALRVADAALVLVDAVAGVEVGTDLVWSYAAERGIPRMIVVNKMDRENANFEKTLNMLRESVGKSVVAVQLPLGAEASFNGVIDLVEMKAYLGAKGEEQEVTGDVASYREALVEAAAENDDELLMKYLDGEELTTAEIWQGLRQGVIAGKVHPVLCASATKNIGMPRLLETIVRLFPSPADVEAVKGTDPRTGAEVKRAPSESEPFSALVFKTTADPYVGKLTVFRVYSGLLKSDSHVYNTSKGRNERVGQLFVIKGKQQEPIAEARAGDIVSVAKLQETSTGDTLSDEANQVLLEPISFPKPVFAVAVEPKAKGDEEKISSGLARMTEEDPTIRVERNALTMQTILSGMGELHLEIITDRLKRKFGVDVVLDTPRVPYKETIRGSAKVEGKHKKQTGGRGQYGHVWLEVEGLPSGSEFEFVDRIFGGAVPRQYIPAVEKGVREAMAEGVLAGYPVTDIRVTLYDGSYHTVDSSEMAFKIAASMAFKKGCADAKPVLLEPIYKVEVLVPDAFMGDVMGDLNKKRGRILGMEPHGHNQVIRALVPQAEMMRYAIDLRSITQGRGLYTMEFSHYEEVPAHVAESVVEQAKKAKE
jgi:elongation factor G